SGRASSTRGCLEPRSVARPGRTAPDGGRRAWIQAPHDDPLEASLTIATLSELPAALEAMR
ncbi:MAG TPA: hypothetical protein VIM20_03415, partial [Candidatus Limnocylindrales bacterium]